MAKTKPSCGYYWSTPQLPGIWHTGHTCKEESGHGGSHVCSCGTPG